MLLSEYALNKVHKLHPSGLGSHVKTGNLKRNRALQEAANIVGEAEYLLCQTPCTLVGEDEASIWEWIDDLKFGESNYEHYGIKGDDYIAYMCEIKNMSYLDAERLSSKGCGDGR
jgi:hypothetical protein